MNEYHQTLNNISDEIKEKVITILYNDNNFDTDQYNRIIDNVVHSLLYIKGLTPEKQLGLYYAGLLYPVDKAFLGNVNTRTILESVKFPKFISDKGKFVDLVVSIINNTDTKSWKNILYDSIALDKFHPKIIAKKAREIVNGGLPISTKRLPCIKFRNNMYGICHRAKRYNSFMEYLYHVGLFLGDNITSNNQYLISESDKNQRMIVNLILLYGNQEYIDLEIIDNWAA